MQHFAAQALPGDERSLHSPQYHVAPFNGWVNDPNGPLYYNGMYHMFFQHLPGSAVWGFNLVWGHAASKDLVNWELLPHAIEPTPGTVDGDGCFSGCAVIDKDGTPALLYTGVRMRGNVSSGPLPPPECDLGLPFIESQCIVRAEDPHGDARLPFWHKSSVPIIPLPPPRIPLAGWRDPYVVGPPEGHPEHGWTMLIGSGIKDQGGTVLQYRSRDLTRGWELLGELCSGLQTDGTGIVWECPLLVKLPCWDTHHTHSNSTNSRTHTDPTDTAHTSAASSATTSGNNEGQQENGHVTHRHTDGATSSSADEEGSGQRSAGWFFCISPDACTNPSYFYIGDCIEQCPAGVPASTTRSDGPAIPDTPGARRTKFLVSEASGPYRLDLGDILYAPNTLLDRAKDRVLLWGWMQEARKVVGEYTYAGCLSCPRELWLREDNQLPPSPTNDQPTTSATHTDHTAAATHADTAAAAAGTGTGAGSNQAGKRLRLFQRPVSELSALRVQSTAWLWPPPLPAPSPYATAPDSAPPAPQAVRGAKPTADAGVVCYTYIPGPTTLPAELRQDSAEVEQITTQLQHISVEAPRHESVSVCQWARAGAPLSEALHIPPGGALPVPSVSGPFLDLEFDLTLAPQTPQSHTHNKPHEDHTHGDPTSNSHSGPGNVRRDRVLSVPGVSEGSVAGSGLAADATPAAECGKSETGHKRSETGDEKSEGDGGLTRATGKSEECVVGGLGRVFGDRDEAFAAPPKGACSGLLLRSWQAGAEGAAAILYSWATGVLEVVFEAVDPITHQFSLAAPGCRRIGGKLAHPPQPGESLQLRVLLDYSLLEIFTGGGEVLSTRVYRGNVPSDAGSGVEIVSVGCTTRVSRAEAYEMRSCWSPTTAPLPHPVPPSTLEPMTSADLDAYIASIQTPEEAESLAGVFQARTAADHETPSPAAAAALATLPAPLRRADSVGGLLGGYMGGGGDMGLHLQGGVGNIAGADSLSADCGPGSGDAGYAPAGWRGAPPGEFDGGAALAQWDHLVHANLAGDAHHAWTTTDSWPADQELAARLERLSWVGGGGLEGVDVGGVWGAGDGGVGGYGEPVARAHLMTSPRVSTGGHMQELTV